MQDALGREFDFGIAPLRVVSLVPSLTESLFELGAGSTLVGITEYCIFPPDLDLPRVGGTKNPKVEVIRSLKPDLVHVNVEENLERHASALREFVPVFASEPKSVRETVVHLRQLGAIHHRPEQADSVTRAIEEELSVASCGAFRFACPIWKKPWMWCGGDTYVSDLITSAGGENVLSDVNRYPARTLGQIAQLQPDVVLLPDEPFEFTDADAVEVAAATGARVLGPFPGHLATWHGTRTLLGLRFLRDALRG